MSSFGLTHLFRLAVLILVLAAGQVLAQGGVHFINLSNRAYSIARSSYVQASAGSRGEGSVLAVEADGTTVYEGWFNIEPGQSKTMDPGYYYIEQDGKQITLRGKQNNQSKGFLHPTQSFELSIGDNTLSKRSAELKRGGYVQKEFEYYDQGKVTLPGNAYALEEKVFLINIESRSLRRIKETYSVPGPIAYYTRNVSVWGADVTFSKGRSEIELTGSVEGEQPNPFAARDPGYINGSLSVFYTRKKPGASGVGLTDTGAKPAAKRSDTTKEITVKVTNKSTYNVSFTLDGATEKHQMIKSGTTQNYTFAVQSSKNGVIEIHQVKGPSKRFNVLDKGTYQMVDEENLIVLQKTSKSPATSTKNRSTTTKSPASVKQSSTATSPSPTKPRSNPTPKSSSSSTPRTTPNSPPPPPKPPGKS